jgi:cobalt-zinc-cadmium efflux system protein
MSDSHNHSHSHAHGHAHSHAAPKNFNKAFAIGIFLNIAFVIIEASYGFLAKSLALVADAGHNLSDVIGLILSWAAVLLSQRNPTQRIT